MSPEKPHSKRTHTSEQQKAVAALFDNLPEDPRARVQAVSDTYRALRQQASPILSKAITQLLQQSGNRMPAEEATEITQLINHSLADARLSIVNPKTELHSTLVAQRSHYGEKNRGYLRIVDSQPSSGGRRAVLGIQNVDLEEHTIELAESGFVSKPQRSR